MFVCKSKLSLILIGSRSLHSSVVGRQKTNIFNRVRVQFSPLQVKDVTEDGCMLVWKPPDDDGGEPITHYEVEKHEGGKWVPCARVPDCGARIQGLKKGQQYQVKNGKKIQETFT